jgi:hypothetical protein
MRGRTGATAVFSPQLSRCNDKRQGASRRSYTKRRPMQGKTDG